MDVGSTYITLIGKLNDCKLLFFNVIQSKRIMFLVRKINVLGKMKRPLVTELYAHLF